MLPNAAKIIADMPTELHCAVEISGISVPSAQCVITGANGTKDVTEHGRTDGVSEVLYIPMALVPSLPDNGKVEILRYGSSANEVLRITGSRRLANRYWALTVGAYYG